MPLRRVLLGGGGVGGAVAWLQAQSSGILASLRVNLGNLAELAVGFASDATRQAWRLAQTPAFAVVTSASGSVQMDQAPALFTGARISDLLTPEVPALEMVQVVYGLVRNVGGNAQAAVGTAWTNPANAINGTDGNHNASSATCAGSIPGNTNGIELSYLNHALKGELTITSATLRVYGAGVDASGLLLDTVISYNLGAGLVTLETIQGAWSNLTTPRDYVIPLTTWTQYDALQARMVCIFAAASALANASLDAIEIVINATRTDAL